MYTDIYNVIVDRLTSIGGANIDTALGADPPLPAAQPYMAEDKEIRNDTIIIRELTYAVKVTVGHNETGGGAQQEMLALLDIVRDGFAGWRPPDLVGIQDSFSVPSISIADFKDHGSTVYIVLLRLRVAPETFNRI